MVYMRKAIGYAAEYKKELWLALFLILLSVIAGVMPYFVANKMIVGYLEGTFGGTKSVILACSAIAAFLILKSVLNAAGITFSHRAAYGTLYEMRKKFSDKIATMPLGDVTGNGSGFYKEDHRRYRKPRSCYRSYFCRGHSKSFDSGYRPAHHFYKRLAYGPPVPWFASCQLSCHAFHDGKRHEKDAGVLWSAKQIE